MSREQVGTEERLYDEITGTRFHGTFTADAILVLQRFREKQVVSVAVMLIPFDSFRGFAVLFEKNPCDADEHVQAREGYSL